MAEELYLLSDTATEAEIEELRPMDELVIRIILDLEDAIIWIKGDIEDLKRINLNALIT
jgi:hypothetical protein